MTNSLCKKIIIGILPLLLIFLIAFIFYFSQIIQALKWRCTPERYYTVISSIVDKYPALFDQTERGIVGNYTVTRSIANKASNLFKQELWFQFLLTIFVTIVVVLAFSLPTIHYWYTNNQGQEPSQEQKQEPSVSYVPQIHIDARLRFIETLMSVCGIVISFFGGSAFLKGTVNLLFFVGFIALIVSLICGFLIFGYVRGGIGTDLSNDKIEFDAETEKLLGNIAPWQFWLLVQGVCLLVLSIIV